MSSRARPVLRYYGGKWVLAPWILSFFPPHRVYVEAFGGAASVLLRKPRSPVEVYNDLDGQIVNVFRVLQNPASGAKLAALLQVTPFSRAEYALSFQSAECPIEQARRSIIRSFMGFGGDSLHTKSKSGFRGKTTNPNHHRNAALDWANYPHCIPSFVERLTGVTIEQRPAAQILKTFDAPDTLFYLDPPYVHETRGRGKRHGYEHEMTNEQHEELISLLPEVKGMVVLSGYAHGIYDRLGWEKTSMEALADGARARTEVLWLNPAAASRQSQVEMSL